MNNTTNLSSLIWSSADDVLRGLFKPSEYGRVILPFVVMRRLDCVLEPKKDAVFELYTKYKDQLSDPAPIIHKQTGLKFFNISKYDLSRIKSDPTNVLVNFDNYIQGYSKNVLDIIENFSINPLVEKLHKNKRLYVLIDKFTEFDLHPSAIDNHQMGSVYEELLRRFSEMSNEESGDHFTPRDVVKLLVSFVFGGDKESLQGEGKIRSIFDPCCGTGGMLTIGKDWVHENINPDLRVELYGQELNDVTYSICKSDFLILDENPENIKGPYSTLSNDLFPGKKFDYMITNPPFGVSWKSDEEVVKNEAKDPDGRFSKGIPWVKDGQLLFLSHMISKMNESGSRIGLVTNGSPLTTGDGARGESQFRRFLIENDLLETIVILPDDLFFNTGILCYLWIVTNKKKSKDRGKVCVIDCLDQFTQMYKPIGEKRKEITESNLKNILDIYHSEKDDRKKYFSNEDFLYKLVTVHEKLRDENGNSLLDKNKNFKKAPNSSEKIKVPFNQSIDDYLRNVPNIKNKFWIDDETIIGSEFHITKYFYKAKKTPDLTATSQDLTQSLNSFGKLKVDVSDYHHTSGGDVYWFGTGRSDWDVKRIDECFLPRNTKVDDKEFPPLSVTKKGVVPQLEHVAKSNDTENRTLVKINDFVINSRSDRKGSCGVSQYDGSVSNVYTVLIPNQEILLPEYVHYLFRTIEFQEEFYRFGKGIVDDLWTTSYSEMREIVIPNPSLEEQREILSKIENIKKFGKELEEIMSKYQLFSESSFSKLIFSGLSKR